MKYWQNANREDVKLSPVASEKDLTKKIWKNEEESSDQLYDSDEVLANGKSGRGEIVASRQWKRFDEKNNILKKTGKHSVKKKYIQCLTSSPANLTKEKFV